VGFSNYFESRKNPGFPGFLLSLLLAKLYLIIKNISNIGKGAKGQGLKDKKITKKGNVGIGIKYMPNTTSAKKSLRQSEKRRKQNLRKKRRFRILKKEIKSFIKQGKVEEAKKLLPLFQKAVDKAAKTNTIHKNKGSRLKSWGAKFLQNL